jgi:hypothetical protein
MSEPLKLTGPQKGILTEGIVGAYPDPDNLWYLLTVRMEVQVSEILQGDTYKAQVFNLIQEFFANGRIGEFIRIVVADIPNSPFLSPIKKEFAGILDKDIGNSGGQDTTGAASLDLGEIAKNTDWYTFKEYGKTLGAIAPPKDRALKVVFMAAEPRAIEGSVGYGKKQHSLQALL